MLNGAHREIKQLASQVAIYWRYGRGAGSIPLASFKAPTLAEALERVELTPGVYDPRYISVCMEQLDDYRPLHIDELISSIERLKGFEAS
jgi:hypothetical protein